MELIIPILVLGISATASIDIWAYFSNRFLNFPRTNWGMVGRWLGHLPSGKITHHPINSAMKIKYELALGWAFHYFVGLAYSAIYLLIVVRVMDSTPTFSSAWLFGIFTLVSPWLILQPALGLGICAHKAPKPNLARTQNLIIHSIFGLTLYFSWIGLFLLS